MGGRRVSRGWMFHAPTRMNCEGRVLRLREVRSTKLLEYTEARCRPLVLVNSFQRFVILRSKRLAADGRVRS